MLVISEDKFVRQYTAICHTDTSFIRSLRNANVLKNATNRLQNDLTTLAEKQLEARNEYNRLVELGKIRPPTYTENLISIAKEHPDNSATQAAKRLLAKRGISY